MTAQNLHPRRGLILGLGLLVIAVLGLSVVMAQPLVQSDGRINQVTDFGGDALYCMDATNTPTNNSASFDHFELLSGNGQSLWTLPRSTVEEGLGMIKYGGQPVLLGNGHGTFGEINLYGNAAEDGSPYFIFTGFDDHYKPNIMTFYACSPVGTALPAPTPTVLSA